MNNSGQVGENAIYSNVEHSFKTKNRRLVYNRTGRFSALAGNRDRLVPGGTGSEVQRWN